MELLSFKTPLLCSGFFNGGQSLSARLGITSQGLNGGAPAQEAFESIVCKANDKERRKAQRAGKTQELVRKREEIGRKREEALVKSRGGQQLTKKENEETVENLEYLLLADVGGAMSVGVLQLREEEEIPVGSLRVKDFPRQISMSTKETQSFDSISTQSVKNSAPLSPSVSKADSGSCGALLDEFKAMNSKLAEEIVDSIDAATDDSEEDWIEVEVDEVEDEDVELWEGDLPPMTAAEEEELLREAEIELAELEKAAQLCKNKEVISSEHELGAETEDSGFDFEEEVPTEKSEMEKKLAELKNLVKQMEEELATEAVANDNVTESPSAVDGSLDHAKKRKKAGLSDIARTKNSTDGDWEVAYEMAVSKKDVSRMRASETNIRLGSPEKSEYKEWDDEEDEVEKVKERGIPAVMRCFDRAKIYVKAGNGGNGVVAFRREKFVPFGGPAGGNGGRGGHVYIEADSSMNSLLPFRNRVHFRAGRGSHGGGKSKEGAVGTDIVVKVPPGTIIREAGPDGKVLLELTKAGQRQTLLPGGAGGRGNVAFKTGRNNAPQLAEFGEEGVEMWVELELKLVADVGIVGVPNAGKSTLLSAISAAKPEIANYPFTTLLPNLGVVALDYDAAIVVADLPGLLEGAHSGVGLGHEFLRHTERCRVLVHVVDGMSLQPVEEYQAVRLELQLFNPVFADKPHVVAFNKMDIPEAAERWESFQANLRAKGVEPLCMSAATGEGTQEVIRAAHVFVRAQDRETKEVNTEEEKAMEVADMVRKQKSAPIEEFTIVADKHTRTWQVNGAGLERFTQMTNWEYFEAVKRFQHVLVASGVNKALRTQGVKEGDTVVVGQFEFQWIDSEDMANLGEWKRGVRGSKVWPH